MILKDIDDLLDSLKGSKNEEKIKLTMELRFLRTFIQFGNSDWDSFSPLMYLKIKEVKELVRNLFYENEDDMYHFASRLLKNIPVYVNSKQDYVASATMTEEHLFEFQDSVLKNLYDLQRYHVEWILPMMSEYKILQELCRHLRDFNGLTIKGSIDLNTIENLSLRFQFVVDSVCRFCFDLWVAEIREQEEYNRVGPWYANMLELDIKFDVSKCFLKLARLLVEIIPVELEVLYICSTKLKASKSREVGAFIKQLLKASPRILQGYLILLQERMINVVSVSTPTQNIHVMIEFLLIILTDISNQFVRRDKLNDLLVHSGVLTRDISILVGKSDENTSDEGNINGTISATLNLQQKIEHIKGDIGLVYLKAPDSSQLRFPKGDGLLFMNLLVKSLNQLLNSNAYSVALIKKEIAMVKEDLEFLRLFFRKLVGKTLDENGSLKDLWGHALDVAYEAENVINSILGRDNGLSHLIFSLPSVINKLKLIVAEVTSVKPEDIAKKGDPFEAKSSDEPIEPNSSSFVEATEVFAGEEADIIDQLLNGPTELDIISIVGMPGLGKTTLANKVYKNTSVTPHFNARAWCKVSQKCDRSNLLQKILNQVTGSKHEPREVGKNDIAEEVRTKLYEKRYLIVLDDVWDITTAEKLIACFPKVERGSRIILTSRSTEVALKVKCYSDPLYLRCLTPEESWELFRKKVFGEGSCPVELSDVGQEIAGKCQGLPLVVVLIAGVIARKEKKKNSWLKILKNTNSFVFRNEVQMMKVMQLSYDHLAVDVKPCLLYLARFAKNKQIKVSKLKQLWLAEGFVENAGMKSLEETAEIYLGALISSSLLMVSEGENNDSKITSCHVHDIVHDFCDGKSRKEKFFKFISSSAPPHESDFMQRRMSIDYNGRLLALPKNILLSNSEKKESYSKHLLSLKVRGWFDPSYINYLRHLRLLRVLDLDGTLPEDSLLQEIGLLIHLRFLKIRTELKALPLSLSNLWNLETLLVWNSGLTMVLLPRIWKLVKLRHVRIKNCTFFGLDSNEPAVLEENSNLDNLTTLSHVVFSESTEMDDVLERLPNLQHLRCSIKEPSDLSIDCIWFPKLDILTKLESLYAKFARAQKSAEAVDSFFAAYWRGEDMSAVIESESQQSASSDDDDETDYGDSDYFAEPRPCDFHFPASLMKLTLHTFLLTPVSLSTIMELPKLEMLELVDTLFEGDEWDASDDSFENLKILCLIDCSLSDWYVEDDSFPKLEQLTLERCRKLKEIPSAFANISSLKSISVTYGNTDLGDSAVEIKDWVATFAGEDRLHVHVSDPLCDV